MNGYKVLVSRETYRKVTAYMDKLQAGAIPGRYLQDRSQDLDLSKVTAIEFIELLIRTKRPQIFAEFEVYGNGIDWNQDELSILGDDKHLDLAENPPDLELGGFSIGVRD